MKEFGSDFHEVPLSYSYNGISVIDLYPDSYLLASGRQCLIALIKANHWKKIWIPDYYCYTVIESIKSYTNIEIRYYKDNILHESPDICGIDYHNDDAILVMNFFGIRNKQTYSDIKCTIIEDHSHSIYSPWATNSEADWCFSSLRKTLPIPVGGILWSPKKHILNVDPPLTNDTRTISRSRWRAMRLKRDYLSGYPVDKQHFLHLFRATEEQFDYNHEISSVDPKTRKVIDEFDIVRWSEQKKRNWKLLKGSIESTVLDLQTENSIPFSLCLLVDNRELRDQIREELIREDIYPAILWKLPPTASTESRKISETMLSIHCDARYSEEDIQIMSKKINQVINNHKTR